MIIEYSNEIDRQCFVEQGKWLRHLGMDLKSDESVVLADVPNPSAALDREAISRCTYGPIVFKLFNHPMVPNVTSYDGTLNEWFRYEGTWPATIDTITHLRGQRESVAFADAEFVLDVACGNGMAGIYAADNYPNLKTVDFSDVNPYAVQTAAINADVSRRKNLFGFQRADGLDIIGKIKYDVIIAGAIPATPGYPGLRRELNPVFEGTDALEKILRDASDRLRDGGKLLISYSSAGETEFQDFAAKYGASVDRVLYQRENAYRTEFLGDQDWVDFLVEKGGIRHRPDGNGKPYWHTVSVKEVSYK